MKIKMKTLAAGPDGVWPPGSTRDVPEAEAKALIKGRYAEPVEELEAPEPPGDDDPPEEGGGAKSKPRENKNPHPDPPPAKGRGNAKGKGKK